MIEELFIQVGIGMKSRIIGVIILLTSLLFISCTDKVAETPPVAQTNTKAFSIGNNSWDTLQEAVNSIKEGAAEAKAVSFSIKLNGDIIDSGAEISGISSSVLIDFGSYSYTLKSGGKGIIIDNEGLIEITGGKIKVEDNGSLSYGTVIKSSTNVRLIGTTLDLSNASLNAVETTGGSFIIEGTTSITTKDDREILVASGDSKVTIAETATVVLTGGLKMEDKAEVALGNAKLKLTQDIEKGDECKLEVETDNIEPQNNNVHQDKTNEAIHNHSFSSEWLSDNATHHWHIATCEHSTVKGSYEPHAWSNWSVVKEPTRTEDGLKTRICTVCGKQEQEAVPAKDESGTSVLDAPIPSLESGLYPLQTAICFSSTQAGTTIWYSLGDEDYKKYGEPVILTEEKTAISVYASKENGIISETKTYYYSCKVPTPQLNIEPFESSFLISLIEDNSDIELYYTLDGSNPLTSETREQCLLYYSSDENCYYASFLLGFSATVNLVAHRNGFIDSDIVTREIKVILPTPLVSHESGEYSSLDTIIFSCTCDNPEATILYTVDGSDPLTSESAQIWRNNNVYINNSMTFKAVAIKEGCSPSEVVTRVYVFRVPDPVATITESSDCSHVLASFNWSDWTSDVYYTVDGTDPTVSETAKKYSRQDMNNKKKVSVELGKTIKCVAVANSSRYGYENSNVISISTVEARHLTVGDIGPSGGYVFYDKGSYSDGWRYLEAAPADLCITPSGVLTVNSSDYGYTSNNAIKEFIIGYYRVENPGSDLYVNNTTVFDENCTNNGLGEGSKNTRLLVDRMKDKAYTDQIYSGTTNIYAARLCDILSHKINGVVFDDWFLPSIEELSLMYTNLSLNGLGSFSEKRYWSSTEYQGNDAHAHFGVAGSGAQVVYGKNFNNGALGAGLRHISLLVRPVRAF